MKNLGQAQHSVRNGFTLIELLLVLVIIAIASAIAIPNITSGQSSAKLKSAARDVASALRFIRGQALVTQQEKIFTLNLEKNRYQVSDRNKSYKIAEQLEIKLDTAQSEIISEGVGRIRFYPDGSSTGGRVTLTAGEMITQVDVNWLTGEIKIADKE